MVSGVLVDAEPARLDPAKLLSFPTAIDIDNDIFIPQKTDKFMAELDAALDSRYLLQAVTEREPTMADWHEWFGGTLDPAELIEAHEHDKAKRQEKKKLAAAQLINLVKPQSLTQSEAMQMLQWQLIWLGRRRRLPSVRTSMPPWPRYAFGLGCLFKMFGCPAHLPTPMMMLL